MAISVLIVEDDRNIAELLQMYLEKEGYAVTMASDGGQGLTKFRSIKPDLVLLDVMMPVMDGWNVCKNIRAESQTPVIIIQTAYPEEFFLRIIPENIDGRLLRQVPFLFFLFG